MDQDFRLKYVNQSWVHRYYQRAEAAKLNFMNSTSFAFHDVASIIRRSRRNYMWKCQCKAGLIDLAELNRRRGSVGFPPIGPIYVRRFVPGRSDAVSANVRRSSPTGAVFGSYKGTGGMPMPMFGVPGVPDGSWG